MIKIMVVDDNALVRRAVCETIDWAAMGCEIEGRLTNGIEGFQYAKEHHPDIIITDIKMPGMDGLEMVKALKEEYDTVFVHCHYRFRRVSVCAAGAAAGGRGYSAEAD